MRPVTRALLVATTGAASFALAVGPALAATTLDPTKLARGADPAVAHVEGKTLVDGAFRVRVRGAYFVTLLGESGSGYVVAKGTRSGKGTILRIEADGSQRTLAVGDPYSSALSSDGTTVVVARYKRSATAGDRREGLGDRVLTVVDATTGAVSGKKAFKGYPEPLDVTGTRVLLGGFEAPTRGTFAWDLTTGAVTKVSRRIGTTADAGLDLLVSFTKDPYANGCTVVSRLSNPAVRLWRSCSDAVAAISPDGSHLATVNILTDGLGPHAVKVRTLAGAVTGDYKVKRIGYFGNLLFEDADTLLLDTTAGRRTATVRCTAAACDLASDVRKAEPYRASAAR